MLEFGQEQHS